MSNLQMNKAAALRKAWGDKPCDHPSFAKEYHLGTATGDKVCTQCGRAFWNYSDSDGTKKLHEQTEIA
jgi:hypothetical protein